MQQPSTFTVYNASAGSGKTFTLVKEYLKIVLKIADASYFRNILAVTFTNKAAAEMKERVINNLRNFTNPEILETKPEMFLKIEDELQLSAAIIQKRSAKVLQAMLDNYAAFNITTIDSFTHRLIRSFAFDLGLSLNFDVEMDAKSLLNEAVDALIAKIGDDKQLTDILIEFSLEKADDDKSWDITRELSEIAQLLLNENDRLHVAQLQERSVEDFVNLKQELIRSQKNIEKDLAEIGRQGLQLIEDFAIEHKNFYYSQFPKFFQNLIQNLSAISFNMEKGLGKSIENNIFYTKNKPEEVKTAIDSIINPLLELYFSSEKLYKKHTVNQLFITNLIPLAVLNSINKSLEELKEEKNIRLNAEFNQLISKNLQEQPVAFIYERIGERFKHYFIDEMQDTSLLQWQNLVPLIHNALSQQDASLLLVGDIKQSIYRWRGSEPEQFSNLSIQGNSYANNPFFIDKKIIPLETNYRSYSQIIDFNNQFFKFIANHFNKKEYAEIYANENNQKTNTKKGGFVQISFIEEGLKADEKDLIYSEKVVEILQKVTQSFSLNEICVLTRTRKQGIAIADFLTTKGIDIISSETLLLQNSNKTVFIIDLLSYLQQPTNKEAKFNLLYFLHEYFNLTEDKHAFFKRFLDLENDFFDELQFYSIDFDPAIFYRLSLYESVEYIIRSFKLNTISDAYLQFFLDEVLQFSLKRSIDATAFLEYWNDKKDSLSIVVPQEKNAVQIMTIHKAKGLEFPVVIYPYDLDIYKEQNPKVWYPISEKESFNNFDTLLVNCNKTLEASGGIGEQLYQYHKNELELDNFNLIYVALTRAIEQLYIVGELKKNDNNIRTSSQFFKQYLQDNGFWQDVKHDYQFGIQTRLSRLQKPRKSTVELSELTSTSWQSHNIMIVANSQLLWDTEVGASITYGNLIHELLAKIKTEDDIQETIDIYTSNGTLTLKQGAEVKQILISVVTHPQLKDYYQHNIKVLNEREILTDKHEIIIPDRVVLYENKDVILIDYKTGKPEKKYYQQLNNYAEVMNQIGYKVIKKMLVYISDSIMVEEV